MKIKLLKQLIKSLETNATVSPGLCSHMTKLRINRFISNKEYTILSDFILVNKPTPSKHSQFYSDRNSVYWWDINDVKIRIEFLNYLIKIEENKKSYLTRFKQITKWVKQKITF